MKNNKGFTLIEIIIYIALFTLLMGTAFVTAYQLIEGSNKLNVKTAIQQEGNFVVRKINWVITNLDPSVTPIIGGSLPCSQTLRIEKINFINNPVVVSRNSSNETLEIQEGLTVLPLTTNNVQVTCFQARIIPHVGTSPRGITATTTINGVDFVVTKYLRK